MTDLPVGTVLAGYRIESRIGRGGMSVVYLAEHIKLGRKVALKLLAPELVEQEGFRERFERESRLAASLEHPNIVPVFDAGEVDDLLYIAMRYVDGKDLGALIRSEGRLDQRRVLSILAQVANALDTAHRSGLVHRDVKPGNILVSSRKGPRGREHSYLSDFGLTKQAVSQASLTGTGQFMGTLDYVAPEQIEGKALDGRTDGYALGCVLYECLAGVPPFRREHEVALMYAHLQEPPPMLTAKRPDLPAEIDEVIATAMAKEKGERYPTCSALIAAAVAELTGIEDLADLPGVAPSPSDTPVPTAPLAEAISTAAGSAAPGQPETVLKAEPAAEAAEGARAADVGAVTAGETRLAHDQRAQAAEETRSIPAGPDTRRPGPPPFQGGGGPGPRPRRSRVPLIVATAVVLIGAAAGGAALFAGGNGTPNPSPSTSLSPSVGPTPTGTAVLSLPQYVGAVNGILGESRADRLAFVDTFLADATSDDPVRMDQAGQAVNTVIGERRTLLDQTKSLHPPPEAKQATDLLISALRGSIASDVLYQHWVSLLMSGQSSAAKSVFAQAQQNDKTVVDPVKSDFLTAFNALRVEVGMGALPPNFLF
jgi:hypothetical protein